ncbi:MAG: hypothetical protein WAK82_32900 [Streptosporangiaceae bacterium]
MTDPVRSDAAHVLASQASYLIGLAGRAPSVHNTQPWRFRIKEDSIELRADVSRRLQVDPDGREMLISCGAALYGLRLAIGSLGYRPVVELLPKPGPGRLLARVRLGHPELMPGEKQKMLRAMSHRHTHRGPFEPEPLPTGLLESLRQDAEAEGAVLSVIGSEPARSELATIVAAAAARQDSDRQARGEIWLWTRGPGSPARDGVPAYAFPAPSGYQPGRIPQRDFDLGRDIGGLTTDGPAAAVAAVLCTPGDDQCHWLRAGQALYRLLLRASCRWVFADLNTQPLEEAVTRARITEALDLPGSPQMLLQLGVSRISRVTARRSVADLTGPAAPTIDYGKSGPGRLT